MGDRLIKALAKDGQVRIIAASTTELVRTGTDMQNTKPTASAALGRLLTAGALMGSTLKGNDEFLTLKINGKGPAGSVVVTAYENNKVKGYIGNPAVDLPPNEKGKLDVSGAIGMDGHLYVIRDMGLKEPYVGQSPIYTGEIGDDIAYYYTTSEQTPSAVGLGVLVDKDAIVSHAGGFIIQMMPGSDPLVADLVTYRLEEIPSITALLAEGKTIEEIIEFIFEGMDLKIYETSQPIYHCDCNRDRVERALISVGKKDLEEIYLDSKDEELRCNFCDKVYIFTPQDVKNLIDQK